MRSSDQSRILECRPWLLSFIVFLSRCLNRCDDPSDNNCDGQAFIQRCYYHELLQLTVTAQITYFYKYERDAANYGFPPRLLAN